MSNIDLNSSQMNIIDTEDSSINKYNIKKKKKGLKKKKIIKKKKENYKKKDNTKKDRIEINKTSKDINISFNFIIIGILLFIIILLISLIYFLKNKKPKNITHKVELDMEKYLNFEEVKNIKDKEFNNIKKYIKLNLKDDNLKGNKIIKITDSPKISIVIPVYNGEEYIKTAVFSIQNQNFKDIEIIIINDGSKDNSINVINELMQKDQRISLYQNEENKGALYSKTKGVLNSKGKYVMILDQECLYAQKDAFSILYEEAEKENLYILGFASMIGDFNLKNENLRLNRYIEAPIIFQPYISRRMYVHSPDDKIVRNGDIISNYFFKTEFFIHTIKFIKNITDKKMNFHDDFLLFFILTRNSYNLKQIKKIFYFIPERRRNKFIDDNTKQMNENLKCLNYLYYANFLLDNTINSLSDKKIATFEFENWFLNHKCKNNTNLTVRNEAKNVSNLFLNNEYVDEEVKIEIKRFLKGINK